jgi:exonuclease III
MRANINIGTLNMRGATARNQTLTQKWSTVNSTLNKFKTAILALQETHLDQPAVDTLRSAFGNKMNIIYSATPNSPRDSAGVAFVINKTLIAPNEISFTEIIPGRALDIRLRWLDTEHMSILNVYAPNNKAAHPEFWDSLPDLYNMHSLPPPDFMIGDFNLTEDNIDRAPARMDNKSAIDALRRLRHTWNLQDAWRHAHPTQREYSYRTNANGSTSESRLDRIYAATHMEDLCFDWQHAPSPISTDHWLVKVKYTPRDTARIGPGRWQLPIYALENETYLDLIKTIGLTLWNKIQDFHHLNTDRDTTNPQLMWEEFKADLQKATKKQIQKSLHKMNLRIKNLE